MMSQQAANAGRDFETAGTLVDAVFGDVTRWGDRPAVLDLDGGEHIGYARLAETVRAAAGGLLRRGLRPGDTVGLDVIPSPQCVAAAYAVLAAGGVVAPVGGDLVADAAHLSAHDARLLLAAPQRADAAIELAERSRVRQVIAMGEVAGATSFADLLADDTGTATCPLSPESPALLPVDGSGPYDHRHLLDRVARIGRVVAPTDLDTVLIAAPPGDGAALLAVLSLALLRGATVLTSATMDLTRCRRVIADQGVRLALLAAPTLRALAGPRLARDAPSLTAAFSPAPALMITRNDPEPKDADAIV
jgi:acyl-CoA synthetase (AMP-forming)/AMP-acid ligase II